MKRKMEATVGFRVYIVSVCDKGLGYLSHKGPSWPLSYSGRLTQSFSSTTYQAMDMPAMGSR